MQLFFSPLACSLTSRITAYEAGLSLEHVRVDRLTKQLEDGRDYREIHPLGLVPALLTDEGVLVTENAAVLQYLWRVAQMPLSEPVELQRWLSFIATELHKGTFNPVFDPNAPAEVRRYALGKGDARLGYIDRHLAGREFLLDAFSPADAYLYTVLNWTFATKIDLAEFSHLKAYHRRLYERDSVRRAMDEERPLYEAQQAAS